MMASEQLIKKKTIKYFIQQKVIELVLGVLIIVGLIFLPYLLGHYIGDNKSIYCDRSDYCDTLYSYNDCDENADCGKYAKWGEGTLYLIGGAITLFIILLVFHIWCKFNWRKARARAEKYYEVNQ